MVAMFDPRDTVKSVKDFMNVVPYNPCDTIVFTTKPGCGPAEPHQNPPTRGAVKGILDGYRKVPEDAELAAIEAVVVALRGLAAAAQRRVLDYAAARFLGGDS